MKKTKKQWIAITAVMLMLTAALLNGCTAQVASSDAEKKAASATVDPNEEYVWISACTNMPMFMENDIATFKAWGEYRGVKTTIAGPVDFDISALVKTIDETVARKPAGIIVAGWDASMKSAIDRAVEAGIPITISDMDIDSNRQSFCGTDWKVLGEEQGKQLAKLIGGKGKVAYSICLANSVDDQRAFTGFKEAIAEYPEIELVADFQSEGNAEKEAQFLSQVLAAHPDLAGFASDSAPCTGYGAVLRETGKAGKVKFVAINLEEEILNMIKEGVAQATVGQKRKTYTFFAAEMAYYCNHPVVSVFDPETDKQLGITPVPDTMLTGIIVVDESNIDMVYKK